ncbi:MAG: DUF481 domain-containing protein [Acidobacteriota bacterium]|nr:DUF481 domain-containing protein [Acidobacteriota bacterium]
MLNRSVFFLITASCIWAQAPAKPEPDTLVLTDGEKLIGKFVGSTGSSLQFKSDAVGQVNVDWSKVQELHTAGQYAVIPKTAKLGRHPEASSVPRGTVAAGDQKIEVASKSMPVGDVGQVVDAATFDKAINGQPNFFRGWQGSATLGASFVEATQNSRTLTDSIALVRVVPTEDWLERRDRTTFNFSSSYGLVTQPNTPTVKTSIYHADAERDEYLSPAIFGFGQALFDHNYSQGLDLQQTYVGGIGWSVFRRPNQTLDLKGGMSYIRQQFAGAAASMNLASSVFDEKYMRKFFHGTTFTQEFSVSPSWTESRAFSAFGSANLALPVYKRFSFSVGTIDTFLNDPPPGFKKNSVQFSTGLTYTLH